MRTILLLLLATHTASADDQIWIGGGARALRSTSADAVTGDSLPLGMLGYAHALPVDVPGIRLWAEAGFSWGAVDGTMFQTMDTHVSTDMFIAGARAQYPLLRWLDATGRADVGTAHTSLDVANLSDGAWGALAQGAVGFDLYASRTPVFSLMLRTELGYTLTQAVGLTPHADVPDGTIRIDANAASIGHLDLSGRWFAFSLVGAF
jgi:hypothetical protein